MTLIELVLGLQVAGIAVIGAVEGLAHLGVPNPGTVLFLGGVSLVALAGGAGFAVVKIKKWRKKRAGPQVLPSKAWPKETLQQMDDVTLKASAPKNTAPTIPAPRVLPHDAALNMLLPRLRAEARFAEVADMLEGAARLAGAVNKPVSFDVDLLNLVNASFDMCAAIKDHQKHLPKEAAAFEEGLLNAVTALHGHAKIVAQSLSAQAIDSMAIRQKVIDAVPV